MSALADALAEVFFHTFGYEELGVFRPTVVALGETNFFFAERFAVRVAAVVLVWGTVPDVAVNDDESGLVFRVEEVW